jgi:dTDP-4-amino-4,6-dideoxygalactose transaminase
MLYLKQLADLPVDLPSPAPIDSLHAWHLFPIRIHANAPASRDEVIALLTENGIGSSVHYRPLHQMTYWRDRYPSARGDFPVADRYFDGALTLPLFPGIRNEEIERVTSVLRQALGRLPS